MSEVKVLLIEDDADDYLLTCDLLAQTTRGTYEVTWCADSESGLEALHSGDYDICLVDFRLGVMTGIELIEQAAQALRRTPTIILAGAHSTEIDLAAMEAGAADYLVKNQLTADSLERAIRYALQRRDLDIRLEHLAFHDPLTDLPNRMLFADRVAQALARRVRARKVVSVVFFDLDNFKDVNDTRGHAAGDRLLQQVARRISSILRSEDTLARLGGDEFAVCIESNAYDTSIAAAFVNRAQEALELAFDLDDGVSVDVRASFGIASSTFDDDVVPDELLRNADIAMYDAKRLGKNTWSSYQSEMHQALQRRIELEKDLQRALRSERLDVVYQPFLCLQTNRVVGFEALCRWNHPDLGPQSPEEFIAIAEDSGAIFELGRQVLVEATSQAMIWRDMFGFDGFMSVNVSPRQISHPGFHETLVQILESSGLPPAALVIEFTESVMTGDVNQVIRTLDKLAELGIGIALDDFGTGYSSLSNVHQLPITIIKVDRSFVARIDERKGRSMLETIATMARSLEVVTIAEGIETTAQRETLGSLGYHFGQGFLFDRARKASEVEERLFPDYTPVHSYDPKTTPSIEGRIEPFS
ncbi:MAG: EAL domain-containing protein [Acidimicrobiia bacterium]|nr:EAL domain-containing protein [Acidimicrobiia bacterium]